MPATIAAPAVRTLSAPNGTTCTTSLTYGAARRLLATHTAPFAASLLAKIAAGIELTQNQAIYVYILAEEVLAKRPTEVVRDLNQDLMDAEAQAADAAKMIPTQPAVVTAPTAPFSSIVRLFAAAKKGVSELKIRVKMDDVNLTVATGTKPGRLYVKDALRTNAEGYKVYYGTIHADGGFAPSQECYGDVLRVLEVFAKDPVRFCVEYGQRTGECCFCGRDLTDDSEGSSVTVGYGPICAAKWGLPHAANERKSDKRPATVGAI